MPIRSYVVHPREGQLEMLLSDLMQHPACTAYPSDQGEVAVLVTETDSKAADKELYAWLQNHPGVLNLTLTFADVEEEKDA